MKLLNILFPNDPHGYKKHRFVGQVWLALFFIFQLFFPEIITIWGAFIIGFITLYITEHSWEKIRELLYDITPSMQDVLWTLRGGLEISVFRLVVYLIFRI